MAKKRKAPKKGKAGKRLDDHPLKEEIANIKHIRSLSSDGAMVKTKKTEPKAGHVKERKHEHIAARKPGCGPDKGYINALSYWAGVSAGNLSGFFTKNGKT